jgi:vancomycin resistance protein YoaR
LWAVAVPAVTVFVLACVAGISTLAPPSDVCLNSFATDLSSRTPGQRHNARLAAGAIHGAVLAPGSTFSFNRRVGNWTSDAGYRRAPVSFEGRLVTAVGGGVCQTSSALYNAALLAGLSVVERHRHAVAPAYVPPGRDAAVAYNTLDLRIRNPYASAVRVVARTEGDALVVSVTGSTRPDGKVRLVTRVLSRQEPSDLVLWDPNRSGDIPTRGTRQPGSPGWRVVTYRDRAWAGGRTARERISDDTYQPVHSVRFTYGDGAAD